MANPKDLNDYTWRVLEKERQTQLEIIDFHTKAIDHHAGEMAQALAKRKAAKDRLRHIEGDMGVLS